VFISHVSSGGLLNLTTLIPLDRLMLYVSFQLLTFSLTVS
jgi:hypothetical protein